MQEHMDALTWLKNKQTTGINQQLLRQVAAFGNH